MYCIFGTESSALTEVIYCDAKLQAGDIVMLNGLPFSVLGETVTSSDSLGAVRVATVKQGSYEVPGKPVFVA